MALLRRLFDQFRLTSNTVEMLNREFDRVQAAFATVSTQLSDIATAALTPPAYLVIENNGSALPKESALNFTAPTGGTATFAASDDAAHGRTNVISTDSGATPGSYGDHTHVPVIGVDRYGRVTGVFNQTITFPSPSPLCALQFTTYRYQLWIGGDPQWLMAADADKDGDFQGYRYWAATSTTQVAFEVNVTTYSPTGGTMIVTLTIWVNGLATTMALTVPGTGLYGNVFTYTINQGDVVGVQADSTGTASGGQFSSGITVTML